MKAYGKVSTLAALAAAVILAVQFVSTDAFAGKRKAVQSAPSITTTSATQGPKKPHIACDPCLSGAARKYSPQYGCFLGVTC